MTRIARWVWDAARAGRWHGRSGPPRSSNGASSHHLRWEVPGGGWTAAEATLEVRVPPADDRLRFWALQVSFTDRGRGSGGGHLGLQWHPGHPGSTAVCWGGYGAGGAELAGRASPLPSATGNRNTRDLAWHPARRYRLRIAPTPGAVDGIGRVTSWRGEVTDLAGAERWVVRDLGAVGTELTGFVVWTESFADCDGPHTEVAWSQLRVTDVAGRVHSVERVRTSYQRVAEGGCTTSDSVVVGGELRQATGVPRTTPPGTVLHIDGQPPVERS